MANRIQLRRGIKSKLPTLTQGEPAYVTDTRELFIGTGSGNVNMGGSMWYKGTDMSGDSTAVNAYSYSACPLVKVGDTYLNTSNGNVYDCTTAGSGTSAKWTYKGCLRGENGKDATEKDSIKWWIVSMAKTYANTNDASTKKMVIDYAKANQEHFGTYIDAESRDGKLYTMDVFAEGELVYFSELNGWCDTVDLDNTTTCPIVNMKGSNIALYPEADTPILYFSQGKAYVIWDGKELE